MGLYVPGAHVLKTNLNDISVLQPDLGLSSHTYTRGPVVTNGNTCQKISQLYRRRRKKQETLGDEDLRSSENEVTRYECCGLAEK
jgi:hypothetical protein